MARTLKETTEIFQEDIIFINILLDTSLLIKYNRRTKTWRIYEEVFTLKHRLLYYNEMTTDEMWIVLDDIIRMIKYFRSDKERLLKLPFFNPSV